jgi:WD40 repeat protein
MLKNYFKTPEGLYKVDLQINKHAVNKGVRPQYTASRSRLLSTKIDLIDNSQGHHQTTHTSDSDSNTSVSPSSTTSSSNGSASDKKFDPYGVFLSFNTNDNKVYCYNLMNMKHAKDCGEPLDRLSCDVSPTCHKMNATQIAKKKLDILIGFTSGDIVIHSAITKQNGMFNRHTLIDKTGVKCVAWSPVNNDNFVVAHSSGNIYIYNRTLTEQQQLVLPENKQKHSDGFYHVSIKVPNTNPVARYHISNSPITDLKFSPDGHYFAVTSNDGHLRVIDFMSSKLIVAFKSYYGALTCCCWSPDGKYVVTGGEDDMISVFDIKNRYILARGIGHTSFVSSVIFDPMECNMDQYRFLSVGDDCKLILWNIDKVTATDESAGIDIDQIQQKKSESTSTGPVFVPSPSLNEVPTFEPVRIHRAHHEPIRDVTVFELGIVTVCNRNIIKFWLRPKAVEEEEEEPTEEDAHLTHHMEPDHHDDHLN